MKPHCGSRRNSAGLRKASPHRSPRRLPKARRCARSRQATRRRWRRRAPPRQRSPTPPRAGCPAPVNTNAASSAAKPTAKTRGPPRCGDQIIHSHRIPPAATAQRAQKQPAARIGEQEHDRRQHDGGERAQREIAGAASARRARSAHATVPMVFGGHDPVWVTNPPNRRSRRRYSAIAPSSAARSKSGQLIGTKTSSL